MHAICELLSLPENASQGEVEAAYGSERRRLVALPANDEPLRALDAAYNTFSVVRQDQHNQVLAQRRRDNPYEMPLSIASNVKDVSISSVGYQRPCPECRTLNPVQATLCEKCGCQISESCPCCGQLVVSGSTVCPRCETHIPEYRQRRFEQANAVREQIVIDRAVNAEAKAKHDAAHQASIRATFIFWSIALVLAVVVCTIAIIVLSTLS